MSTPNPKRQTLDVRIRLEKATDAGIPLDIDYRDQNGKVFKTTEYVLPENLPERIAELSEFST